MLPAKPCLPTAAPCPPSGPEWLHVIKHDGLLAHHDGGQVRLISRRGLDWGWRFPAIVAAIKARAVRSCIIDGELIACDTNGLADFQLLRSRRRDDPALYCAFDLIELDGRDLRDEPIETRKAELAHHG
jgi:ATP-dependent DNA ligase